MVKPIEGMAQNRDTQRGRSNGIRKILGRAEPFLPSEESEIAVCQTDLRNWLDRGVTPKAIQDLLDELETSKQSRLRAWNVLQRLRLVLSEPGNIAIPPPA